ncbi:MAG: Hsp20/alpha crystallin family protein [Desulfuromonadales bacterium]|nr:Hsp20/alpha crystallin family protein [Desulfuromonadales bacterium]
MMQKNVPVTTDATSLAREETRTPANHIRPAVDIFETEQGLHLLADLPGVGKEGLSIDIHNGVLTIQGKGAELPGRQRLLREFDLVSYYRQFQLPEEIDAEKVSAELKNGVLTLQLPKAEAAKPRRIEITSH